MLGYKVSFKGLPKTFFACATVVDDYIWENRNPENVIEFSIAKSEKTTFDFGENQGTVTCGHHFSCVPGQQYAKAYCDKGVKNEIISVAVKFEHLNVQRCTLTKEDAKNNSVYLLPAILEENAEISHFEKLLNQYISLSVSEQPSSKAMCISVWFELLSALDESTRRSLIAYKHTTENYYVKKLDYIIEARYGDALSLSEIAKDFGISMSYLSGVYKNATGQTFRNALYCMRMNKAKALIMETSLSCEEIAKSVGLCDETYLRKRFKAFFGVSISQFRNIYNELTLYHEKPVRK